MTTSPLPPTPRPPTLVCPLCRQGLQRRPRRFTDRLRALWQPSGLPLLRYACRSGNCGWQGLLRGELPRSAGYLPQQWLEP